MPFYISVQRLSIDRLKRLKKIEHLFNILIYIFNGLCYWILEKGGIIAKYLTQIIEVLASEPS